MKRDHNGLPIVYTCGAWYPHQRPEESPTKLRWSLFPEELDDDVGTYPRERSPNRMLWDVANEIGGDELWSSCFAKDADEHGQPFHSNLADGIDWLMEDV